ncbi:MAG: ABC transporter permease [Elusimicrobia bacterium]|nr:ABC transporter permease [Elusimicrobiota bacterium]
MTFELFVAWRYLRAKRKGLFAALTTSIGVLGVTTGVAALITTLSVMNGFQSDIQKKIIGAQAHITIYGQTWDSRKLAAAVEKDPEVSATAPFILGQAIFTCKDRTVGAVLKGLDPEKEFQVNDLAKSLREGSWAGIKGNKTPGIVLGEELARHLGAWVGEEVVLVSPQSAAGPLGLLPRMQKFKVEGLLHTGYYEYDASTAYTSLEAAAGFFGVKAEATGLGVKVKDLSQAESAAKRLQKELGLSFLVRSYQQMNRTLFAALKLEKAVMFLILALIILVAALNIASTLILRSVEKTRDIGLLKAMGATPGQIRRVFAAEGLLIGGLGLSSGLGLGLILCWIIKRYPIVELPADIYYLSQVPVSVEGRDVLAVAAVGIALCLLATIYPAARAAKVDPVEAIHYG